MKSQRVGYGLVTEQQQILRNSVHQEASQRQLK